MEGFWS